ncbi:hypothetical protein LIER_00290 [Lithospermum erythrorhizon]|uniref:Uncharacterized protein n=1 Tax=Lithospermum erythrorhizon TaxID=34254 RepID=A0AAV3NGU3_LITER
MVVELISWNSSNNNSFIIWDNFSSFIRRLNIYELINLSNHQKTSHSKMILLRDQLKACSSRCTRKRWPYGTSTDADMDMSSILQPKEYEDSDNADEQDNNNQCKNMEDVDSENYGISDSIDFSVAELELIDSLSKI